ncbi:DUF2147 domain-containing protein [Roseomonas sp. M0104]|uniref:DUF2147 domain-containing protein n=1 Tax=Teichococcus coralli TaxID=2545983 RepID=A0A845BFG3_9PROT|nr:DUF2147 domain-containing protein [Pseudoroseomonas coralli]MXP64840.1 DUF2147 domain-containing protein [Pseudoroseomonas coralli]
MLIVLAAAGPVAAQDAASPIGQWLIPDGEGVIEIGSCGRSLCGWITGMALGSPGEPVPRDAYGRPQCGLQILTMQPDGEVWRGTIMDPRDGAVWRAEMWLGTDGNLRLRGYLGIPLLGRTQTWTPFAGRILPGCRLPRPTGPG